MEQDTRLGPLRMPPLAYLAPMVAMWAIALGIVVVQRDLGAALLFFGVFLAMLYVATGRISLVIIGLVLFLLGSALMAMLFDHIRIRVDIWLDPFADPLGAGYQVVQALHAFARGGLLGVGLGAGLPEIGGRPPIPEVHTDFPLAALGEEMGIVGVVAILGLYLVVVERGLRIGAAAADDFRSLLAIGLALVIGIQAFIIAAGTLKVLPLTGVTLPFISYGGSSLLANALVIGLLLALSDKGVEPPPPPRVGSRWRRIASAGDRLMIRTGSARQSLGRTTIHVAIVLSIAFGLLAGAAGYWGVVEAPGLVRSPNDAAVIAAARTVPRGLIKDRTGKVLADNKKDANGELYRVYAGRAISQVVGYASSVYGRAGLERSYDAELSGLAGDPVSDALAKFGADRYDPKDLTLSLSYDLQRAAVAALGKRRGAVVMLDPATGEVLALASTPTYDASAIADPSTAQDDIRGPAGRPDPATPAARHARTVRARIGVQDRDRRGRPRLGCDHVEDHVQEAAACRGERAGRRRLPGA